MFAFFLSPVLIFYCSDANIETEGLWDSSLDLFLGKPTLWESTEPGMLSA